MNRNAFTLLELMASMAITAIVALTLAATLRYAFDARDATARSLESRRSAELVMEIIRNDLQSALPPSRGTFQQTFEGLSNPQGDGNDDLAFYTTAPTSVHMVNGLAVGNGDIKAIEITAYKPANSTDQVLVRRTMNNLLASAQNTNSTSQLSQMQGADEEVLCRQVVAINFQYYTANSITPLPTWDSTAASPVNTLPTAVQVTLQLNSPSKNADGSQKVETYTRVFQLPCIGASNDASTTTSASGAGGGT